MRNVDDWGRCFHFLSVHALTTRVSVQLSPKALSFGLGAARRRKIDNINETAIPRRAAVQCYCQSAAHPSDIESETRFLVAATISCLRKIVSLDVCAIFLR